MFEVMALFWRAFGVRIGEVRFGSKEVQTPNQTIGLVFRQTHIPSHAFLVARHS